MNVQFSFHPERCVGCGACVMACVNEKGTDVDEVLPNRLLKKNEYVSGKKVEIIYFTHSCMHCKDRPCEARCPKKCFSYDPSTGVVVLDNRACVGCHACEKVCPYEAIRFTKSRKAAKCDGCIERLKSNRLPQCVLACPRGAITVDEKNAVLEKGRSDLRRELERYRKDRENRDIS